MNNLGSWVLLNDATQKRLLRKGWRLWWVPFLCQFGGKGWGMVLFGRFQGFMAQMIIM